jgi:hypothetical protein
MNSNATQMNFIGRWIVLAVCGIAFSISLPAMSYAQSAENVKKAMALLKAKTSKLGAPSIKGKEMVAGKSVPALYFGQTKLNNNYGVVDEDKK